MALTAAEQYLLELMNRARLDPAGEARRFGIDLNDGLAAGSIGISARQVLAPNALLETAAVNHSLWMIQTDTISHAGANGSTYIERIDATGYRHNWVGEDIAWTGQSVPINLASQIDGQFAGLFNSATHRAVMLASIAREVGIGQEGGIVRMNGYDYHSSAITVDFGAHNMTKLVTGVVYDDLNRDSFYSMGEGQGGAVFSVGASRGVAQEAGGYAVAVAAGSATSQTAVTGTFGALTFRVLLDLGPGNAKLDLVGSSLLMTSASMTLVDGIQRAQLLGVGYRNLTGNNSANELTGNSGANLLNGQGGNDRIFGKLGNDNLSGGDGADRLEGGYGADILSGGAGGDLLFGGLGSDRFIFRNGAGSDRIADFTIGSDRLQLGQQNWSGRLSADQVVARFAHVTADGVSFDFDASDHLLLLGLTSTAGLAAAIDLI